MKYVLIFFLLFPLPLNAEWKGLEPGLDYQKLNPSAHLFRIQPKQFHLDILLASDYSASALTAEDYKLKSHALLVINGGFFDELFHSLGLLHRKGQTLRPLRNSLWGIFLIGTNGPSIIHSNVWRPEGASLAIQAGPRLLVDGVIPVFKESGPARRSAVGITKEGWVIIAATDSPMTLGEWAKTLQSDCIQALNLDGGGSTQISATLPILNLNIPGITAVPNALGIFRTGP